MTRQINYAVVDIETGGFSKTKNGLCEIAVIIVSRTGEMLAEYQTLIKPYKRDGEDELVSYKEDSMKVNGIKMHELESGKDAEEVGEALREIFVDYKIDTFIGHNVSFDKGWINEFMRRFGSGYLVEKEICTLKLAKEKVLKLENYKLPTVLKFFGISNLDAHRAFGDTEATLKLWKKLTSK